MSDVSVEEFRTVSIEEVPVLKDSVVIDLCSVTASGWHERMETSGVTAFSTAVTWPRDDAGQALLRIQKEKAKVEADDRLRTIRTVDDIRRCKAEGTVGLIFGAQNTDMLNRQTSMVEVFHAAGLRFMQLNYNERNFAADGCLEDSNAGLSFFGRELIEAMNETGVVVDLANAGIQSSLDAIDVSTKPSVFAHGNPRATALEQQRNVTDEQIQALASKGGVLALVLHTPLAATTPGEYPTIHDYIKHIEYAVDLVGIDHVAIGSDSEATPGNTTAELSYQMGEVGRQNRGKPNSIGSVSQSLGISKPRTAPLSYFEMVQALQHGAWGVRGLEHIGKLPNLVWELQNNGWSTEDLQKLLGGNVLRVYEAVWTD